MAICTTPERGISDEVLHLLHQLTEKISARVSLNDLLDFVFDNFHNILPYNRLGYASVDHERQRAIARWSRSDLPVKLKAGFSASLAGSSLEAILQSNKPRILNDLRAYLREQPYSESTRLIVREGMQSSLTCPLVVQGRAVGFLFFTSDHVDCYSAVDVEIFQEIAGHLAWLVERCQMADDLRRASEQVMAERARRAEAEQQVLSLQKEASSSSQLQALLFPKSMPQQPGFRLAAHYQPSHELGSGFFDILEMADGRCGILLADCSEGGYEGLMLKTVLHTLLQSTEWTGASAAQIMAELHGAAARCFPHGSFAAAVVGILDPINGSVYWSDSAYPVPILVKSAGYTIDGVADPISAVIPFNYDCLPLEAGDKVLFHSDSLLRVRAANGEEYGSKRLHEALHHNAHGSANEVLDHLWQDLYQFLDGLQPSDDLLAAVIERRPDHIGSLNLLNARAFSWRQDWYCQRTEAPVL